MDGKRLFYTTKKKCGSMACQTYHKVLVEKIEKNIIALFNIHVLNNKIIPSSTSLSESTHTQYIDINGVIHIRSKGLESWVMSDIVNFRLLKARSPLDYFQSLETPLEPVLELYDKHLVKPRLELRYDRRIKQR